MKQGPLLNRILMLVLFAALLIYLGVYVWDSMNDPFTTATAYACTVDDAMEATGFLVREEQVIQGNGAVVDQLFNEGEKVARGQTVAVLYGSAEAAERRNTLLALENERDQLQYALTQSADAGDNARLSGEIIDAITTLRSSVASEDFTRLEDQTLELKSLIYQRADAFGTEEEGGTTVAEMQNRIQELNAQISALQSQSSQDTTRVTVSQSGTFSGMVDGFETLLTPDGLENLTPADLDKLSAQTPQQDTTAVGKLITSSTWYFVCALSEEEAANLTEGKDITVRFSWDWSGSVDMEVERLGPPQGGRMTVILSTDRFLADTTLLRKQTVDLVFRSKSGIRVPTQAIRTEERSETNEETGETTVRQVTGVYAIVGVQAEFKEVTVVDQREGYCVVTPVTTGVPGTDKKALRSGDEIIVTGKDLFDGKVVR